MSRLQTEWEQSPTTNDEEALGKITAMQSKVNEGIKAFQQSKREYTAATDEFAANIQKVGEKWGTDKETLVLVQEATDQLHQECLTMGKQVLNMFTELVGGMDDGRLSLARQVAAQK